MGDDCKYVVVRDISIILKLCPSGCSYCPAPDKCTTCQFDNGLNKQLYYD